MINQLARYLPVLPLIERAGEPILEVGSGGFGMGRWSRRAFVGCDRSFDDYGPAGASRAAAMRPVRGDAVRLPFRDASFAAALCLDTVEHLPAAARREVVREVCRVTRGPVIMAFPCGDGVAVWDRRLAGHLRRRGQAVPAWLEEHLAVEPPDPEAVIRDLEACGRVVAVRNTVAARAHYLLMCAEARSRLGRKLNRLAGRLSAALLGRPRHRLDALAARAVVGLHRAAAGLVASRRGYRVYLVAERRPAPGSAR